MARETTLAVPLGGAREQEVVGQADRLFLGRLGLFYVALSLALVLAVDRFWSANWDAQTFLGAARTFWDGGSPWDLYATSRATSPWPYAYPPLFALALAPFVWLADAFTNGPATAWPQLVALRLPLLVADVAIAAQLHAMLRNATGERWIARLGAALWLVNPVLLYHTALQAHLETLWLWPTLVAYRWLQERPGERLGGPLFLLVVAMAVKQTALLWALPVGLWLLAGRRWGALARWAALAAVVVGGLCLPFALHSDDFRFMVTEYVATMPVQIQGWQVWTLALDSFRLDQVRTTFPTIRFAPLLTIGLNVLLAGWALRRGRSWVTVGCVAALAFLLTSQKAMGYHYPMVLLWLLLYTLRSRRFALAGAGLVWSAWVVLSPYFAPWAAAHHLPGYAALGTLNSLFVGWLLWRVLRDGDEVLRAASPGELVGATRLVGWATVVALPFALACLAFPLRGLLPDTLGAALALLAAVGVATLSLFAPVAGWAARAVALPLAERRRVAVERPWALAALVFVPLCFTWFTMNAEVTAVIERGVMAAWGLR